MQSCWTGTGSEHVIDGGLGAVDEPHRRVFRARRETAKDALCRHVGYFWRMLSVWRAWSNIRWRHAADSSGRKKLAAAWDGRFPIVRTIG